MKIAFTPPENEWLHARITAVLAESSRAIRKTEPRVVAMRYKFQGAGPYVYLNGKERTFISKLATMAMDTLTRVGKQYSHTDWDVAQSIAAKVTT